MGKDKESYEKNLEKFEELSRDLDEERRSKKKKKKDRKRSPSPVKVCLNSSGIFCHGPWRVRTDVYFQVLTLR